MSDSDYEKMWRSHMEEGLAAMGAQRYADAVRNLQSAVTLAEFLWPGGARLAESLRALGSAYAANGDLDQAEGFYLRSISIGEAAEGRMHPNLIPTFKAYAALLQETGRMDEARNLERRIRVIES